MKTSVASVTFRRKSVCEVAELARRAGLDAIEWGGDIHVPPGNAQAARAALHCTRENGLTVSAYGSYYRAGAEEDFGPVLETALSLGCRVIRVWGRAAGQRALHAGRTALRDRLPCPRCGTGGAGRMRGSDRVPCRYAYGYAGFTRWLCWVKRRGCARSGSRLLALRPQKICTRCTRWKAEWKICTFIIGTEKAPAALWRREQLTGTPILPRPKRTAHSGMPRWSS